MAPGGPIATAVGRSVPDSGGDRRHRHSRSDRTWPAIRSVPLVAAPTVRQPSGPAAPREGRGSTVTVPPSPPRPGWDS